MATQAPASHPAPLLQELAKSKEAQKRQREAEVFILNPQGPVATHTIPKPFDLHDSKNQASQTAHLLSSPTNTCWQPWQRPGAALQEKLQQRRFELKQVLLAEAMRECTFKPRTNEGQNRELINRILRADEAAQECC